MRSSDWSSDVCSSDLHRADSTPNSYPASWPRRTHRQRSRRPAVCESEGVISHRNDQHERGRPWPERPSDTRRSQGCPGWVSQQKPAASTARSLPRRTVSDYPSLSFGVQPTSDAVIVPAEKHPLDSPVTSTASQSPSNDPTPEQPRVGKES